jgi:hypothetical protein
MATRNAGQRHLCFAFKKRGDFMKKIVLLLLAVSLCLPLSIKNSMALEVGSKSKVNLCEQEKTKKDPALYKRLGCGASGNKTTTSGAGSTSGTTDSTKSGSSEHSSVRGTINAGGDFIAPKLSEKDSKTTDPKPKPKSVAPKLNK